MNTGGTPLTKFQLKWNALGSMAVLDSNIDPTTTQYSVTSATHGLTAGNSYSFAVVATNVVGNSADSSTLASIIAATPPTVPLNFARNSQVMPIATSITVSWDIPTSNGGSAISGYRLYWDQGLGGASTTHLADTLDNTRFYTIDGVTKGTSYKFQALAYNAVGNGPSTASLTLLAAQAPNVPTNIVRLTFNSATSYTISWTAPSDNGGAPASLDYEVWTDNGLAAGYSKLVETTGKATSYNVSSLTTGTTYFWKIKAFNEVGISALSTGAGFLAGSVPTAPQSITLVSQSQIQIKFSWSAPTSDGGIALTEYRIYWDNATNGVTYSNLGTTATGTLLYTKSSGLTSGATYKFYVTAKNSIGESAQSNILTVIAASVPSAPAGLYVISQSSTEITIGWVAPSNGGNPITDYIVNYNQGNAIDVWIVLAASTSGQVQKTLSGITTPGEIFQFTVQAKNAIGSSVASSIFPVVAATLPDPPVNLTRDQVNTSKTQVAITWSAGPSNGGSVVIDYTIFWDQGINSFVQATSGITALAYTRSTGISTGTAYKFKV